MASKDVLGVAGEQIAADYLTAHGYEIAERNWRCRAGEIDIVARRGDTVVFCEVKTRSGVGFGSPLAAVTPVKAARIRRLALTWLGQQREAGRFDWVALRFDVIGVLRTSGNFTIEHVESAF